MSVKGKKSPRINAVRCDLLSIDEDSFLENFVSVKKQHRFFHPP